MSKRRFTFQFYAFNRFSLESPECELFNVNNNKQEILQLIHFQLNVLNSKRDKYCE